MATGMNFGFNFGPAEALAGARALDPRRPMRLLLMGNFSGIGPGRNTDAGAGQRIPLEQRPTLRVDADNFEDLLSRLAPRLQFEDGELRFDSLEDFRPEALLRRAPQFARQRELRAHPAAAQQAGAGLLDQLLGGRAQNTKPTPKPASAPAAGSGPAAQLEAMIQGIVAPHIVADRSAEQGSQLAALDLDLAAAMAELLHRPAFQALEAAWRGLHGLVSTLELDDEQLQLHILDASREELLADLIQAQGQPLRTGLHAALAERWREAGGHPWSALLSLETFGPGAADLGLLAALGLVAAQAGGSFIAGAETDLTAPDSPAATGWQTLRRSEAAPWLGLVTPRLLLRLPYGRRSDPVEGFAFEEIQGAPAPAELLWGSGALAVAQLLGQGFMSSGWALQRDGGLSLDGLPAYSYVHEGETELQACAERVLNEEQGLALLQAGLMPLLSHRHQASLSLLRLQSIALPAGPLSGLAAD